MSNFKGFEAAQSRYDNMSPDYGEECDDCSDMHCEKDGVFTTASQVTIHTARNDHFDKHGRLIVKKGRKYRKYYSHGYRIESDGTRVGFKNIFKVAEKISVTVPE